MREYNLIKPSLNLKQFYLKTIKKKQFIYVLFLSFSFGFAGFGLNLLALHTTGNAIYDVVILFCGISVFIVLMLFIAPIVTYKKFKAGFVEFGDVVLFKDSSKTTRIPPNQVRFICLMEGTDVLIELKKLKSIPIRDLNSEDLDFIEQWATSNKIPVLKGTSFLDFIFK